MADAALKYSVSRWVIFALVALAILVPILWEFRLPDTSSKVVKDVYDDIESLQPGEVIVLSFDFDPGSDAELRPMCNAILRQCFRKNLRVICMTLWGPMSAPLMVDIVKPVAEEYKKEEGKDFVLFPYKAGGGSVILTMGQDLYMAFPKDLKDTNTRELPCLAGVKTLKDAKYVMAFCAGQTLDYWMVYGNEKYKVRLSGGCTAVMATDYYPYLQTKQIRGLIGGLGGAYQYEVLTGRKDKAAEGMRPQSVVHVLIVLLIVAGNVVYFRSKFRKPAGA
jgi:hypothetical protein